MIFRSFIWCVVAFVAATSFAQIPTAAIPLPEHPRPDFQRPAWENLNGPWQFRFDRENAGESAGWSTGKTPFEQTITVPFPWGSKLSGVENKADIGWYHRTITVPAAWKGQRIFLVVGASDWLTKGWIDGQQLGEHRGGYTPFEFELTPHITWGQTQQLVLRVDDTPHDFKLEGKQGYGAAKGIWQTPYLEARPQLHLTSLHFIPAVDAEKVSVKASFNGAAPRGTTLHVRLYNNGPDATAVVPEGATDLQFDVRIPQPHLWSLDDPFLYEVHASLNSNGAEDSLESYFGMRKISVEKLAGTNFPYVALNGKPVYLQMTLDQSYHPDGFYTFPSDAFMRDEILRSKSIGLNANRIHIKVEVPRKLYWADRLGLLIMADVPNAWGDPTAEARQESEFALRGMIARDFNHPAIFSWVTFNETWGLFTKQEGGKKIYLPETQDWAASMYRLAKHLDPTRLVEDNSPCNYDHVETDLNTWHDYLPGYAWRERLDQITRDTFPGSKWNFIGGRAQGNQPLFNSECGNVWGYEGSTGDVDWSWDYHIMMNEFRRHPKIGGWLYTEHHDVINEWNGYYRFDRSEKFTGMDALADGMTLRDLHSPFYLSTGSELCRDVKPGASVDVPLFASFLTDRSPGETLVVKTELFGWNGLVSCNTRSFALNSVGPRFCLGMANRYKVTLTQKEREQLSELTRSGKSTAAKFIHARALLLCDAGKFGDPWKVADVATALGVSARTIEHLKQRFVEEGVEAALARKPQSQPRAVNFDGGFDARLTALACSKAPAGRQRWTVRLLAEKLVELKIASRVSTMTVQRSLKKMNCSLT